MERARRELQAPVYSALWVSARAALEQRSLKLSGSFSVARFDQCKVRGNQCQRSQQQRGDHKQRLLHGGCTDSWWLKHRRPTWVFRN